MGQGLGGFLSLLLAFAAAAGEARAACTLEPGPRARVAEVRDGETVVLDSGETVRLLGALAPRPPRWWQGPGPWRRTEAARAALERLVKGRTLRLAFAGPRRDRHGRLLAHLFAGEGPESVWVQARLVNAGHARVYSFPSSRACVRELQAREVKARAARAGLWADPFYAVSGAADAESLMRRRYSFEIVEGMVLAVGRTRRWTFLNFGPDYRRDFTVAIRAADRPLFAEAGMALDRLKGRRLRVRGWIELWNGPAIKATHPEQIELLDAPPADTAEPAPRENPAPKAPGSRNL